MADAIEYFSKHYYSINQSVKQLRIWYSGSLSMDPEVEGSKPGKGQIKMMVFINAMELKKYVQNF